VTYDAETHDVKLLDFGSMSLDAGDQVPYLDSLKQYRIVGALDGSGGETTNAATLTFRIHDEINFSNFIRQ